MKHKAEIIPATIEHCHQMAPHMRKDDVDEIWALCAMKPLEALLYSVQDSKEAFTAVLPDNEVPVLMFGLGGKANVLDKRRSIWLLGTPQISKIKRQFIKESEEYFKTLAAGETVYNYVMPQNRASLSWLKMLGFSIMEAKPYGWLGKPYHYVERKF